MTAKTSKLAKLRNGAEKRSGKRADKKRELARNAIRTLGEIGYARTSLRDIAEQSGVSVGIMHYYFEDKIELISYCVQMYKEEFIEELDAALSANSASDAIVNDFISAMSASIERHPSPHKLWYDIKAQSLFDATFRPVVRQIEDTLMTMVSRSFKRMGITNADPLAFYLSCDSILHHFLSRHVAGDSNAMKDMRAALAGHFALLMPVAAPSTATTTGNKVTATRARTRPPRR